MMGASLVTLFGTDDAFYGAADTLSSDDLAGEMLEGFDDLSGIDSFAGIDPELLGAIENDPELLGFIISTAVAGGIVAALPWIKKGFAAIKAGKGIKGMAKKIGSAVKDLFKKGKKNAAKALQQSLDKTLKDVIAKPPSAEAAQDAKSAKSDFASQMASIGLSPAMLKVPLVIGGLGLLIVVGIASQLAGRGRSGQVAAPVQQSGRCGF